MNPKSLFQIGHYSLEWVHDFYEMTGTWWGADPQQSGTHARRVEIIHRLCGQSPLKILDLGSGPGASAAAMADAGHAVTAIEFSHARAAFAHDLARKSHPGSLTILEADFFSVDLQDKFDLVTYWDGIGAGTDHDQRLILKRIAQDWLKPEGTALIDIFNPYKAAIESGKEEILEPLPGVQGSVRMVNRTFFDPETCRWIDEWQPVDHPELTMAQTLRCYSPADLMLLLEGTGLKIIHIESNGKEIDALTNRVKRGDSDLTGWTYLVQLAHEI